MREESLDTKTFWTDLDDWDGKTPRTDADTSDVGGIVEGLGVLDRRSFVKLLGLSMAAGALAGCQRPVEKIIPYVDEPSEMTPGVPTWYATTCSGCSAACGALAKVREGRPIKLEGNPKHAMSRGRMCAVGQGSLVGLYDPYRQRGPASGGAEASWQKADAEISRRLAAARADGGKVVLLTGTVTGPATRALISEFLADFPGGEHVTYDAISYGAIREAHMRAYGRPLIPGYRFDRASVIVSFGADFLGTWLSPVEFAVQYAKARDPERQGTQMSRHYQFEARMSLTGSNADIRIPLSPSERGACLAALLAQVEGRATPAPDLPPAVVAQIARTAYALRAARGRSLVVSDSDDLGHQTLVLAINDALGNVGRTVDLGRASLQKQGSDSGMAGLITDLNAGRVSLLIIHGCNPAHTWPRANEFAAALAKASCSVATGWTPDETTRLATWHCPTHHPMEAWADAEPQVGRYSLFQPAIRPLYQTRAFEDSLLTWMGRPASFYDYLRAHWQTRLYPRQTSHGSFDAFWDAMLQRGFLEVPLSAAAPALAAVTAGLAEVSGGGPLPSDALELELCESVALRDGGPANNPWLQELPDPLTKITWSNFASVSPALAREKGIVEGQWLEITVPGGVAPVRLPAQIQPGQQPRTVSIAVGYGRPNAGPVGQGVGVDAYPLMGWDGARRRRTVAIANLRAVRGPEGERVHRFARTQIHNTMDGRPLIESQSYAEFQKGAADAAAARREEAAVAAGANLWEPYTYPEHKWGMAIDLSRCIGCSACVTACDLENNVPAVGPAEVARQREMHWMRLDRYYQGAPDAPKVLHQPLLCQHCENASCETVCPVLATVHDDQGLNVQVYNRCVGTRYCANNCPYKVRRFNWFSNIKADPTRNLALNPDVTVRSRGVMEKCSFCLQRIQAAQIKARNEGRRLADGEIQPACQQTCPTDAIIFGDLKDPKSRVSRLAASARGFRVLEQLNRQPAVHYLAKVRNTEDEA